MGIKIKNEMQFKKWFEKNFKKVGYSKILKRDCGKFPDFVMLKKDKKVSVELETLSSNFILHNHDKNKVDVVICIEEDFKLGIPTKEVRELKFIGGKRRISATVDKKTKNLIDALVKKGFYRNKSHVIETAIELFAKEKNVK